MPLYVMMRYLAEDINAPVPSHVVAALAENGWGSEGDLVFCVRHRPDASLTSTTPPPVKGAAV